MHLAFAAFVLVHGLIHVLGFAKAFGWSVPLAQDVSKPSGVAWLATAGLFTAGSVLLVTQRPGWWAPTLLAVLSSQALIVMAWSDARFGTIANVVILLPLAVTLLDHRSSSYRQLYAREVEARTQTAPATPALNAADVAHLPPAVRRYLEVTGSLGLPRVENFHVTMRGEIRSSPEAPWMPFDADQHSFFDPPTRLFLLRASRSGVPFDAFHRYVGVSATMQVSVASLFTVVDARGTEMNRSETVTMLNDMCLLAPATLIDRNIHWKALDTRSVEATFTNAGNTVSAVLSFNAQGELESFSSDDRYLSADGKSYTQHRWTTPVRDFRAFGGRRIATAGEASWRLPQGEFVYARLSILDIAYNVGRR